MQSNTIKNILSLWIFVALIALGVGLALFINKMNAAPEDSKAAALAGATIELGIAARDNVSVDNQLLFNVGDPVRFTVSLPTMPTTGTQKTLILKLQYTKANLNPASNLFVIDSSKYLSVPDGDCTVIDSSYECRRVDITKLDGSNFVSGEQVAQVNMVAKTVTPAAGATVLIYPKVATSFLAAKNSYIQNEANSTLSYSFSTSVNANKVIKIEDQCYGDYNRSKGVSGEVVDPVDLSRFASKYGGATLVGADMELDIDNRGASANFLNASDLAIFASNYGTTTCNRNKSDGLP